MNPPRLKQPPSILSERTHDQSSKRSLLEQQPAKKVKSDAFYRSMSHGRPSQMFESYLSSRNTIQSG